MQSNILLHFFYSRTFHIILIQICSMNLILEEKTLDISQIDIEITHVIYLFKSTSS
jgi:hypothetical protein